LRVDAPTFRTGVKWHGALISWYTFAMIITYHGGECLKFSQGDTTLVLNPHDKKSSFGGVRFGANVVAVSLHHPDFNATESITGNPFVIDTPGEYEVGEVGVRGYGILVNYDGEPRYNTIYQIHFEGINIVHLGALQDVDIDPKILGEFGDIDILILPIGGGDVLQVPAAAKLATKLEAHAVIPVHYDKAALTAFLKELDSAAQPLEKFTIKKKDLEALQGEVVVLSA